MQRVVRIERRKRGFFGWVFLLLFLAFNAIMAVVLFAYWGQAGRISATTEAEQAGKAIGMGLASGMVLTVWVLGAIILGLLVLVTRGSKTVIEETRTGPGGYDDEPAPDVDTSKWSQRDREQYQAQRAAAASRRLAAPR